MRERYFNEYKPLRPLADIRQLEAQIRANQDELLA